MHFSLLKLVKYAEHVKLKSLCCEHVGSARSHVESAKTCCGGDGYQCWSVRVRAEHGLALSMVLLRAIPGASGPLGRCQTT